MTDAEALAVLDETIQSHKDELELNGRVYTDLDALLAARAHFAMRLNAVEASNSACSYPDCTCPFDHPGTPGWCARGLATTPSALELIGAEYQHTETGRIIACIGNTPPSTHWRHVRNIYAGP